MDAQALASIQFLQRQAAALLVFQSVLENEIGQAFLTLLRSLRDGDVDGIDALQAYGLWFSALVASNQTWQDYLLAQILKADNPFSQQAQQRPVADFPPALVAAAQHDLQVLQRLYVCSDAQLCEWVEAASSLSVIPLTHQSRKSQTGDVPIVQFENWADAIESLADHYRKMGTGLFAEYRALRWQEGELVGVAHPDPVELAELACYTAPREVLLKNTEFLLAGYPALHVLLYGSRGSGKSSLVKALLNEYGDRGLRLIEVGKSQLKELTTIVDQLRGAPQKFIIFVDDLSFEEDDDAFKSLKVVLEGSVTARPQNVVVYATSNRRHLVREFFAERPRPKDADEIQSWDTIQEKLSFSDRFGLTLTFEPADQSTYLAIVQHLASQAKITLASKDLEYKALQWATRHNGRSGRTARQFIDFLKAELAVPQP